MTKGPSHCSKDPAQPVKQFVNDTFKRMEKKSHKLGNNVETHCPIKNK